MAVRVGDAVLVVWEDSCGCGSAWESLKDTPVSDVLCKSLGWLVKKTKGRVLIVPHIAPAVNTGSDQGMGDMTIPTKAIRSIKKLSGLPASGLSF